MKLKVCITKSLSPQYQAIPEKNHSLLLALLLVLRTRNNTNGNKCIAWYYDGTYMYYTYCCQLSHLMWLSHSFYHTEWWDSTGRSQYRRPPQGSGASAWSWGQPQPTGQGEHRTEQDPALLLVSILFTCFACFYLCTMKTFCVDYGAYIKMYAVPLLLNITYLKVAFNCAYLIWQFWIHLV